MSMYVLLAGLPGTGKSTLGRALALRFSAAGRAAVMLNKDDIRAALFPGAAADYSEAQNALCMDAMLKAAAYLRGSESSPEFFFIDGRTFGRAEQIEQVLAETEGRWCILHLVCSAELARERLASSVGKHVAADRDFALYLALQESFESIRQPHLVIDTGEELSACVEQAFLYISSQADGHEHEHA